jgi:hypothetical protein
LRHPLFKGENMAANLISINEASTYLNLEYIGTNAIGTQEPHAKSPTLQSEIEFNKLLRDDRQGRPNIEL